MSIFSESGGASSASSAPKTSPLWDHFTQKPNDIKMVVCNHCGAELKAKDSNGAMSYHLKTKHSEFFWDFGGRAYKTCEVEDLVEGVGVIEGIKKERQPVEETSSEKPQLDHEQIAAEVQEVLLHAKDRTLPFREICKKISKPDPYLQRNGKYFQASVGAVLAQNSAFVRMRNTTWKLADENSPKITVLKVEKYSDEVRSALAKLSLKSVDCGEYLVILKSDFDVEISGEPYHALMLLLHTGSGNFMARLWNKTVEAGKVSTLSDLINTCIHHFRTRKLCLGLFEDAHEQSKQEFLVSQTPVPRKISRTCIGTLVESEHACFECMKLDVNPGEAVVKSKTEVDQQLQPSKCSVPDYENEENALLNHESVHEVNFHAKEPNKTKVLENPEKKDEDVCKDIEDKIEGVFDQIGTRKGKAQCKICGYEMKSTTPSTLSRHMATHSEERPFECSVCQKSFKTKVNLRSHEWRHKDTKHKCEFCKATFATKGDCRNHTVRRHTGEKPHRCSECNYACVELAQLRRHQLAHKREHIRELESKAKNEVLLFKSCPFCEKKFRAKSLMSHIKVIHKNIKAGQNDKPVMCPYCDEEFKRTETLMLHKKKVHFCGKFACKKCGLQLAFAKDLFEHASQQQHDDVPQTCPSCNGPQNLDEMETHYKECIKMSYNEKLLLMQQRYEYEISQNMSQRMDSTEVKKINDGIREVHGIRERICPYCNENFKCTPQKILNHKKLKHFWGKFWCPKCNLLVYSATDLINHMQETKHDHDNALVKCPACKVSFETVQIRSHYEACVVKTHHNEVRARNKKQNMCAKCGKLFAADSYYDHLKVHLRAEGVSEEKANMKLYHQCDRCTKRCTTSQGLQLHIKTIHEGIKSQTYFNLPTIICDECGRTFKGQSALNCHMNQHHIKDGKYQCQICGKPNGNANFLNIHMLKHQEPKLKCSHCERMFKQKHTLEAHERDHRGEKPFPCSICTSSFSSQKGIDQHVKGVHKIAGPRGGKTGWCYGKKTKIEIV